MLGKTTRGVLLTVRLWSGTRQVRQKNEIVETAKMSEDPLFSHRMGR